MPVLFSFFNFGVISEYLKDVKKRAIQVKYVITNEVFLLFNSFSWYISSLNEFHTFSFPNSFKESFKEMKGKENIVVSLMKLVINLMLGQPLDDNDFFLLYFLFTFSIKQLFL